MQTQTKSVVTHKTSITADVKKDDGGRSLLMESFDFIRKEKQVGKLTAQFGVGGSISSLYFEESSTIAQKDIEVVEE
jgi:hypothetical protein